MSALDSPQRIIRNSVNPAAQNRGGVIVRVQTQTPLASAPSVRFTTSTLIHDHQSHERDNAIMKTPTILPPLPLVGKRRLLKLIAFLEKLPRRKFDFSQVVAKGKQNGHYCATVACAGGWLPAVFPKLVRCACLIVSAKLAVRHGLTHDMWAFLVILPTTSTTSTQCMKRRNR